MNPALLQQKSPELYQVFEALYGPAQESIQQQESFDLMEWLQNIQWPDLSSLHL